MSCEKCGGSGWEIVRVGENEGAAPCPKCQRTARPVEPRTPLTLQAATGLVDTLCDALAFAPATPASRGVITSVVMEMCETTEQLVYIVKRILTLHTKWDTCGLPGLRQVLCSKYRPKDGYVITATECYPDGVPADHPQIEQERLRLPVGRMSASPELDTIIHQLAKNLNSAGKEMRPIQAEDHASSSPKLDTAPKSARPTQADIETIKEQQRRNQERRKAIEADDANDSRCFSSVIAESANNVSEVITQRSNRLEQAARAVLRQMRVWRVRVVCLTKALRYEICGSAAMRSWRPR